MKTLGGQLLRLALAISIALPSSALAGEPALKIEVNGDLTAKASEFRAGERSPLARLKLTPNNIGGRALEATKATGRWTGQFVNEVVQFQALLIMMGVAHYQMVKQRWEMEQLSRGITNPASSAPAAAANVNELCAATSKDPSEDMLCSGDFLIGMAAGAGLLTGSVIVKNILKLFIQSKNRGAFLTVLSQLGSMSLMIVGGQAASMLWSESVKLLPSAESIEKARGLAGRAGLAYANGGWDAFAASADGELWKAVTEKMYQVLLVDEQLRSMWVYNLFRFGLRGEMATALPTLMGAASVGTMIGAGTMGLLTSGGLIAAGGTVAAFSAPVLSFVIGAGFGFIALNLILDSHAPVYINRMLQDFRAWSGERALKQNEFAIQATAWRFKVNNARYRSESYDQAYNGLLKVQLSERQRHVDSALTAGIEQFYELRLEIESLKQKLMVAETALKSARILPHLYVSLNGEILPFAEARKKVCEATPDNCIGDRLSQLRRYQELKAAANQADQTSMTAAQWMVNLLIGEGDTMGRISDNPEMIFPYTMTQQFSQYRERMSLLSEYMKFTFAATSSRLNAIWPTRASSPEVARKDRLQALQDVSEYYQLSFSSQKVADSLMGVALK